MSSQPLPALKFKLKQKTTTTAANASEVKEKQEKQEKSEATPKLPLSSKPSVPTLPSQPPIKLKLKLPSTGVVGDGMPAPGKKRARPVQQRKKPIAKLKAPAGGASVKRPKLAAEVQQPQLKPPPPIKKFKLKMGGGPPSHPISGVEGTPAGGDHDHDRDRGVQPPTQSTAEPIKSLQLASPSTGPAEAVPMDLAALDEPFIQPQSQQQGMATLPSTSKQELSRLLSRLVEKDTMGLFHKPVTEDVAPGYFSIIKTPMDLSTMRRKLESGAYKEWSPFDADLRLMFRNALTFNPVGDRVYLYALKLSSQARRMVINAAQSSQERSKSGQGSMVGGRGGKEDKKAKGQDLKQIAAARKAQLRAQREAARSVARAEQRAAQEAKILKRAFGGGEGAFGNFGDAGSVEARATLRIPVTDAFLMRWGGLGGGASTEGAPFGLGRQYLRSAHPNVREKHDLNKVYVESIERFACRLHGKAKELVMLYAKRPSSVAPLGGNESGVTPSVNQQLSPQAQPPIQVVLDGNNTLIQHTN